MDERAAIEAARSYFLAKDTLYGCAETTLMVLQQAYGLPEATDSSAAMALNGGVAWRGELCGAPLGAAVAIGRLAGQRMSDHREAKTAARAIVAGVLAQFEAEYGQIRCRDLIGLDISTAEGHARFIAGGLWQHTCMRQIEFVITGLLPLQDEQVWQNTLKTLQAAR
jgi:C_GCAxxG_C_C family probable redox protein